MERPWSNDVRAHEGREVVLCAGFWQRRLGKDLGSYILNNEFSKVVPGSLCRSLSREEDISNHISGASSAALSTPTAENSTKQQMCKEVCGDAVGIQAFSLALQEVTTLESSAPPSFCRHFVESFCREQSGSTPCIATGA